MMFTIQHSQLLVQSKYSEPRSQLFSVAVAVMQNCFIFIIWMNEWMNACMHGTVCQPSRLEFLLARCWCVRECFDVPAPSQSTVQSRLRGKSFMNILNCTCTGHSVLVCSNWKFNLATLFACMIRNNIYTTLYTLLCAPWASVVSPQFFAVSCFFLFNFNFKWLPATLCLWANIRFHSLLSHSNWHWLPNAIEVAAGGFAGNW